MNERIAAGAAAVVAALTGGTWLARWWVRPEPRMPGQLVTQRFVWCPACGVETAATIHGRAVLCAEGHLVHGGVS